MRRLARIGFVVVSILLLAAAGTGQPAAREQQPAMGSLVERRSTFEREVDAGYGTLLRVLTGPVGNVHVSAWREHKIRVEAKIAFAAPTEQDLATLADVIGVAIDPSPTSVDVETKGPHDKAWMKGFKHFPKALLSSPWRIDYAITVPEYTSLSIVVLSGETTVDGVSGIIGVTSASGDVRLTNASGSTQVKAGGGDVSIETRDRSWRGGNLEAIAAGSVTVRVPHGFAAELTAVAPEGVRLEGEAPRELGQEFRGPLGVGGGGVRLEAGHRVAIVVGAPAAP